MPIFAEKNIEKDSSESLEFFFVLYIQSARLILNIKTGRDCFFLSGCVLSLKFYLQDVKCRKQDAKKPEVYGTNQVFLL